MILLDLPYFVGDGEAYRYFSQGKRPGSWLSTRRTVTAATCVVVRRCLYPWLPRLEPDVPTEVLEDVRLHHGQSDVSTLREYVYEYDLTADVAVAALYDRPLHDPHVLNCGPRGWRTKLHSATEFSVTATR